MTQRRNEAEKARKYFTIWNEDYYTEKRDRVLQNSTNDPRKIKKVGKSRIRVIREVTVVTGANSNGVNTRVQGPLMATKTWVGTSKGIVLQRQWEES